MTTPGPYTSEAFPCAPMQAGLVFETLRREGGVYVQQVMLDLPPDVDISALKAAWEHAVARHWTLRSSFRVAADGPLTQQVGADVQAPLVLLDWRDVDPGGAAARWSDFLAADRTAGFDPRTPPLMRLALCRTRTRARLLWTYHHSILDGRSRLAVVRQVLSGHEAPAGGVAEFADFARWANELAHDEDARGFWRERLAGSTTAPSPRGGSPGPPGDVVLDAARRTLRRAPAARHRARAHPRDHPPGRFRCRPGAGKWADRRGLRHDPRWAPVAPGRHPEVVGLVMTTSPVRARFDPAEPLVELLRRLREWSLAVRPYEHFPLVKIQRLAGFAPSKRLIEALFSYERTTMKTALAREDEAWEEREVDLLERLDYGLAMTAYGDPEILVKVHYDGTTTPQPAAVRFARCFQRLLEAFAASGGRALDLQLRRPMGRLVRRERRSRWPFRGNVTVRSPPWAATSRRPRRGPRRARPPRPGAPGGLPRALRSPRRDT